MKLKRITTTIHPEEHIWILLRALAQTRALEFGGRPSMTAVISALVEEKAREADRRG